MDLKVIKINLSIIMKKKLLTLATSAYLLSVSAVFAVDDTINLGNAQNKRGVAAATPLGTIVSNTITIVFTIAALAVLAFMVLGAFNWITSGGDKEKVDKARKTITNALIGLALLGLAFLILRVVGQIIGFDVLTQFSLPPLSTNPPPTQ